MLNTKKFQKVQQRVSSQPGCKDGSEKSVPPSYLVREEAKEKAAEGVAKNEKR